jgi:hypothetical protein
MIHVGIELKDVNEWNTMEEIVAAMEEAIKQVSFPEDAKVDAWFAFLPATDRDTKMIEVQKGFYDGP